MSDTATRPGFDEQTLAALPEAPPFVEALRKQALQEMLALPIPSAETEEWRYTDLSGLDLSFTPHVPGHGGEGMPRVSRGERAATQLQHNSSVVMSTSNQDLEARGVIFCDLDEAARSPSTPGTSRPCPGTWGRNERSSSDRSV